MLDARPRRYPTQADSNFGRRAADHIQLPDREAALEDNRLAIRRYRRPQHAPGSELRDLVRTPRTRTRCWLDCDAGIERPDVFVSATVAHEIERASIGGPHWPELL